MAHLITMIALGNQSRPRSPRINNSTFDEAHTADGVANIKPRHAHTKSLRGLLGRDHAQPGNQGVVISKRQEFVVRSSSAINSPHRHAEVRTNENPHASSRLSNQTYDSESTDITSIRSVQHREASTRSTHSGEVQRTVTRDEVVEPETKWRSAHWSDIQLNRLQ